ncbi:MAG: rRNA pseudouridine synthase, partial [Proteobacteria bacterium]|nr:rRNA pseudouridine synthase [Pseudomonadota bacterium]
MNAPTRNLLSLKRATESHDGTPVFEDRLHKVLANAGLGSRRMLEQRIQGGEVRVNAKIAEIGSSVRAGDRIEIDNKVFVVVNDTAEQAKVLVYNKPEGVVATREDPEGRPTIFEQLPQIKGARWISVGRLDINTTGLVLLTTDGALAHALMHPSTEVEREYVCRVHGEVPDEVLEKLKAGVELEDGVARFDELAVISRGDSHSWFRVTLREGRNREVRRMWESQGLMVSRLKRIRYGNVELPRGLLRGQSETLDMETVKALRVLVDASEPEPSLTLQPVINQRRAKSLNEYRPSPQSQQAWSGAHADEARELRAFDR